MSRISNDEIIDGRLINGFDYDLQAWVIDGRYVRCGHPDSEDCGCYGRIHEGEQTKDKKGDGGKEMNRIVIEGMKAKIPKGWGYWELSKYPWGGSFHRTPIDLELPIKEIFENFKDGTPRRFSVDFNGTIMGFNV